MTQGQLAEKCGQSDSAIRNYELGNRTPGEGQVRAIAGALAISPEALREVPVDSARQALELLFRLSNEFGLEPMEVDGMLVLGFDAKSEKAPKLGAALHAWKDMADSERAGNITPKEYALWKLELGSR